MVPPEVVTAPAALVPQMAAFDAKIFLISAVGASAFWVVRLVRCRSTDTSQWLNDALNIGTLCILVMVAAQALGIAPPSRLAQANGFLICIAIAYCGLIIGMSLWRSVRGGEVLAAKPSPAPLPATPIPD